MKEKLVIRPKIDFTLYEKFCLAFGKEGTSVTIEDAMKKALKQNKKVK